MKRALLNIVLTDDDKDDQKLFKEALNELPLLTSFSSFENGEKLMQMLNNNSGELPDVLFLDLNMPRKSGYECLSEIKNNEKLKHIPVIIYSTSYEQDIVDMLFKKGAHFYICKPAEFSEIKQVIQRALTFITEKNSLPTKKNFVLTQLT